MKSRASRFIPALSLAVWAVSATSLRAADIPMTPKHPVTNTYFSTSVVDDYQWLENFDDPAVKSWSAAENRAARGYLDKLPARGKVAEQLEKLYTAGSANYYSLQSRPGIIFALKFKPPAQQPQLITLKSLDDTASEHVVLDLNKLNPKGTTAMDFFVPSHDGKRVAMSLSDNGSEDGTLFIYDVESGQALPDKIPRVQYPTGGGSVAWNADDTGVYYTRYPHAGERAADDLNFYQQVYFHRLGDSLERDRYELGKDFPRIAEIVLDSSRDGRYLLATVANGDGGEYAHYLLGPENQWRQLTRFSDQIKDGVFGRDGALYFLSRQDAPRGKILRAPLDSPEPAKASVVVAESAAVIEGICPSASGLYVQDLVGGPSQIRFFNLKNPESKPAIVPLMPVSAVQGMLCPEGDQLFFRNLSYIEPYAWMAYDPASGKAHPTALAGSSPADFSDMEVVREFATSKDGTKIPLNIIRRKGTKLDGKNPTLLYGYGGYSISLSPSFNVGRRVWFDQGGIYVVANIRGGGEFGEEWHKAGNLTRKQNVFDDFAAAAEYLIKTGYTRREKLAVEGASNGGLLMGAFLTQHPGLVRAVVSHVGIYDSLRTELEPNGAFNVTEFGTVKDSEQFKALYAYSPYHHVVDGMHYPAVLFLTGDHDGRVNPYNSRKMTARLQAANKSQYPILLRTTAKAGHGMGTGLDERIAEEADVYAFLFDQLGIQYKP
ncbi:MAG TPA: prolyl oligopeptidase family serine peptidase [Verrucomicrobiae bacterium]|jgi:prolyl oligopeptidase|nr:prolyl oligopeptidase family serine peptidase [Verrucomicrobiae bacterium]